MLRIVTLFTGRLPRRHHSLSAFAHHGLLIKSSSSNPPPLPSSAQPSSPITVIFASSGSTATASGAASLHSHKSSDDEMTSHTSPPKWQSAPISPYFGGLEHKGFGLTQIVSEKGRDSIQTGDPKENLRVDMDAPLLPANPSLVGVALTIRSRDGPRLVFHYPARPNTKIARLPKVYGTELDLSDDEEDDEVFEDDDDLEEEFAITQDLENLDLGGKKARQADPWDGEEHYNNKDGQHVVPWEHLFEFETRDLESILTPHKAYHKKRFELTLDPLTYVSYPIHVRDDGTWKKPKKDKKAVAAMAESMMSDKTLGPETAKAAAEKKPDKGKAKAEDDEKTAMTMFNVVFITNPDRREKQIRNCAIYEHIAKKINKALKYAQAQSNYVWKESELIGILKERAREDRRPMNHLWTEILEKSTLARGLQEIYEAISRNKIANIHFGSSPTVNLSVQIPLPLYMTTLPERDERAMPGLCVTTANPTEEDGDPDKDYSVVNKHFALLLLEDLDKLVSNIQAEGGQLGPTLIEYLKISKPTVSFAQLAQTHSIPLSDICTLAQHLIYWRRAMAIPPLHHRDVYVVSPNAPNHDLPKASAEWAKTFPLAPVLPSFLAKLSEGPRPYKIFAPSKDHRPTYMEMLAWLLRGGWVINLRTYCYIIAWPEVIYEAHYRMDLEKIIAARQAINRAEAKQKAKAKKAANPDDDDDEEAAEEPESDDEVSADELAKMKEEVAALNEKFRALPKPEVNEYASDHNPLHVRHIKPHIIKNPNRADQQESMYLETIAKRLGKFGGGDKAESERRMKEFRRFTPYCDGKSAFEMVGMMEGLTRKEVWNRFMIFEEYIIAHRHW